MFQPNSQDRAIIGRLRVKSSQLDPLLAQQHVVSALNTISLHPTGLNPAAILCIRSLCDPKPGWLLSRRGDIGAMLAWERAVVETIAQLARQAARPIHGPVPANAEAVLFADRAELLACLALDWCAGEAWSQWWWQGLFRTPDLARALVTAWLDAIEFTPPALHHLALKRQAVTFVKRLNDETAYQMQQAMIRVFGLSEVHSALCEFDTLTTAPLPPTRRTADAFPRAPWERWLPDIEPSSLKPEQSCLLGIGLMLQRAPTVVRTLSFARAVAEWYRNFNVASIGTSVDNEPAAIHLTSMDARLPAMSLPGDIEFGPASPLPATPVQQISSANHKPLEASQAGFPPDFPPAYPLDGEREQEQSQAALSPVGSNIPVALAARGQPSYDEARPPTLLVASQPGLIAAESEPQVKARLEMAKLEFEYEIETEYGGLFYLINLGLFLNLYSDFTTPLTPGIGLLIWDFIALIGRELVGERLQTDPAWGLLARLAGRGDEVPGASFEPPGEWRLPIEWLEAFPEGLDWFWAANRRRLRVVHPAGFVLVEVHRRAGDPAAQLATELQAYPVAHPVGRRVPYSTTPGRLKPLARWLAWLMPYSRARLQRALGLTNPDELAGLVCRHRARLCITATHLDVFLALADLPLNIRLAGLDRDPGWVPATGRFIAFHFE